MSVRLKNRKTSEAQFLSTARSLELETRKRCISAPKRYTFYGLQEIWATARRIHGNVKKANTVFPTNNHEFQTRRDFLILANAELQDYISQLEGLLEDQVFTPTAAKILSDLASSEERLIKALMKSDKTRFEKLI